MAGHDIPNPPMRQFLTIEQMIAVLSERRDTADVVVLIPSPTDPEHAEFVPIVSSSYHAERNQIVLNLDERELRLAMEA